jgi:hypothetical protein
MVIPGARIAIAVVRKLMPPISTEAKSIARAISQRFPPQ